MDLSLLRRLDHPAPRYTSYPTIPEWSKEFSPVDTERAFERIARTPEEPISAYVHIPFCRELCSFCGCNVVITRDPARVERYLDALIAEIGLGGSRLGRRPLARLHFGGGTPTFLSEEQLARVWRALADHFAILPDAEVAIEIDPAITRAEQLTALRRLGFNRLSMGVQDFDAKVQSAINRVQTVEETGRLLAHARRIGFASTNFDLIYGLPHQTLESFEQTLATVIGLRPDRVAVFSLAYLPDARPNQRSLPVAALPGASAKFALAHLAHERFLAAGYLPIGFDHYALAGDELGRAAREGRLGRDFQGYTTRRAGVTIAFGSSGISDFGFAYAQNQPLLGQYESAVLAGQWPTHRGIWLTADDQRRRSLITQILCNGVGELGVDGESYFSEELVALLPEERDGLVRRTGTRLQLTPLGSRFSRNVAAVFDAYLRRGNPKPFSRTI